MKRAVLLGVVVLSFAGMARTAWAEDNEKCLFRRHYSVYVPHYNPNPVVYDSGPRLEGIYYGPYGIRHQVHTSSERIHASAMDPNRDYADPGSLTYVDRYASGRHGSYREQGYHWTSNGVPHSDVNVTNHYRTSLYGSRVDNIHVLKQIPGTGR
jgi:hypothetical protein